MQVATVLVDVVVLRFALLRMPGDCDDDPDVDVVIKDLNVGVTVADGFVDTKVLALLVSFSGLIGVVVVDAPQGVMPGNGTAFVGKLEAVDGRGFVVESCFVEFDDVLGLEMCEVCCWLFP